jgi:AhpD family alkylhydroperoxidase
LPALRTGHWSVITHVSLTDCRPTGTEVPMSRKDTEDEIVQTLGQIPDFFATMPDSTLERAWDEFKQFQLGDTVLSAREKHLIGYAVAAAIHCPYCTYFHRSATQMMGTNDAQLEEAARMASDTAMYSTYIHSLGTDIEAFKRQTDEIGKHLREKAGEAQRDAA